MASDAGKDGSHYFLWKKPDGKKWKRGQIDRVRTTQHHSSVDAAGGKERPEGTLCIFLMQALPEG
ncbi:MAG: hypothetical protein D3915_07440 [Candidatus Electrothrix sp. AU1_5]|nr:hypothetical protein [Candidatus Electrothrix gigas]